MKPPSPTVKRIMFVNRRAPHGTSHGLESLEMVFAAAAFDQQVRLVFMDDGVYQLCQGQATGALGVKDYAPGFRALHDYGVEALYVEQESLALRGLIVEKLVVTATVKSTSELSALMAAQDVVITL